MIASNTLSQICANAIVTSSVIALVGTGFALVYFVGKFLNFAHGVIFTSGAYFTFLFSSYFGLGLTMSIILGIFFTTILGGVTELAIYHPLRQKGASSTIVLLASLGVYIVIQNFISIIFGDNLKMLHEISPLEGMLVLGARVTDVQLLTVFVSVTLIATLAGIMKWTRFGKALRAIGSDPELAEASGIHKDRVMLWCVILGSAFAGTAGVLVAFDVGMVPTMGMEMLMMAVIAVIVGGEGSIPGIILAALLVGFSRHIGAWSIGSEWQDFAAFLVLLFFLLCNPFGFFGKKARKAAM